MHIPLKKVIRNCVAVISIVFLSDALSAQTAAEVEQRLQKAATPEEKQAIYYQSARLLTLSNADQAANYAQQALQLAVQINNKQKEAESAQLAADLAERSGRLAAAVALYTQARTADSIVGLPNMALRDVERLQALTAKQGNYQAAYHWAQEYKRLLEEKYRSQLTEQTRLYTAAETDWTAQKDREVRILLTVLSGLAVLMIFLFYHRQRSNRRIQGEMAEKNAMIEEKRRRSEQLLLNILPSAVAAELTVRNKVAARRYERATVMFIDFVSFTKIAERLSPEELIAELDQCFSAFDELISRKKIEKIKTVGDAYICASGLSDRNESPADIIRTALQIQRYLRDHQEKRQAAGKPYFEARIGIHFGPVVAGVVGTRKFAYDIWGDTVNTAARMEEACEAGHINVSGAARAIVPDEFNWAYRGKIAAKNKGELEMYYVSALQP